MQKRFPVTLTDTEREHLKHLIAAGTESARKLTHARILLKADQGTGGPAWTDDAIAETVEVSQPTVARIRRQYVEEGLEAALNRRPPTREYVRKLDGAQEARLIALACGKPPEGLDRWTLRLLADKLVELEVVDEISYQTVAARSKRRTPAASEEAVVYPAGAERGVCLADGGCARCLHAAVRSPRPPGVYG